MRDKKVTHRINYVRKLSTRLPWVKYMRSDIKWSVLVSLTNPIGKITSAPSFMYLTKIEAFKKKAPKEKTPLSELSNQILKVKNAKNTHK